MQKLTREMLHKLRDSLVNEIKIRQTAGKIAYVIVGMGECGLQKGAKDVLTASKCTRITRLRRSNSSGYGELLG